MQDKKRWQWLKAGELKWETDSLICAAQQQALRTNPVKNDIDHQDVSPLFTLCSDKVESVTHAVRSHPVLAGKEYRKTTNFEKKVHWLLCNKFEIECMDKWFLHQTDPVLENDNCILWDFAIQTDKKLSIL